MLIVIVIIGILIAALLPRLQGAQAMARDTARQTALTTIGTAIAAYQLQTGRYPLRETGFSMADGMTGTDMIAESLKIQGIVTDVPKDRNADNVVTGIGNNNPQSTTGDFAYALMKKNDIENNGFILMAKTEMPGSSNRVVSGTGTTISGGYINTATADMKDITLCTSVTLNPSGSFKAATEGSDNSCIATSQSQLRYIYMY